MFSKQSLLAVDVEGSKVRGSNTTQKTLIIILMITDGHMQVTNASSLILRSCALDMGCGKGGRESQGKLIF
jgi:hypothetical protein